MHMCDCCCWYVNDARGCEAPRAFKERACQEAAKRKAEMDAEKRKTINSEKNNYEDETVAKRIENCSKNVETTCCHCQRKYRSSTTRDYNSAGMYIEYSFCPDCHHKNLTSWHVW